MALGWLDVREADKIPLQKAGKAAEDVVADKHRLERAVVDRTQQRLITLQNSLKQRVLADAGGVTDFRRFVVGELQADVTRLITQAGQDIVVDTRSAVDDAHDLGGSHADEPIQAANVHIPVSYAKPGLDRSLVDATFDNMAILLSEPMQQFRNQIVVGIRRVAVAGDGRMAAINQLRDTIDGAGFDNAAYRAERIIRTEVSRTFNEATYARLTQLAGEFPFLRKGWRATTDKRTRLTHLKAAQVYARGTPGVIPINDLFVVGAAKLRFPVDPLVEPAGKAGAAETIMCRCNAFVDFDLQAYGDFVHTTLSTAIAQPPPEPEPVADEPNEPPVIPAHLEPSRTAAVPTATATTLPALRTRPVATILKKPANPATPNPQQSGIGTVKHSTEALAAARAAQVAGAAPHDVLAKLGPTAQRQFDALFLKAEAANTDLGTIADRLRKVLATAEVLQGPIKGMGRAVEKLVLKDGGDARNLRDVVRASVAVDTYDQVGQAVESIDAVLRAQGGRIVKADDRFTTPTEAGYRDLNMNVRFANGTIGEIQVHLRSILEVKNGPGHKLYEELRSIAERPDPDPAKLRQLREAGKALYDAAWTSAGGK